MKWQGANTYTVESIDSDQIVQFRSDNEPFDAKLTALAKAVHGDLAPATQYNGSLQGSQVSIWIMEKLPGVGFDYLVSSVGTESKLETAVSDMARLVDARRSNMA
jgi:DNA excision repair protein ERCC-4